MAAEAAGDDDADQQQPPLKNRRRKQHQRRQEGWFSVEWEAAGAVVVVDPSSSVPTPTLQTNDRLNAGPAVPAVIGPGLLRARANSDSRSSTTTTNVRLEGESERAFDEIDFFGFLCIWIFLLFADSYFAKSKKQIK